MEVSHLFLLSRVYPFLIASNCLYCFFSPVQRVGRVFAIVVLVRYAVRLASGLFEAFSIVAVVIVDYSFVLVSGSLSSYVGVSSFIGRQ